MACSRWLTSFLKQLSLAEFLGLSDHALGHPLGQEISLAHKITYKNKTFFPLGEPAPWEAALQSI